MLDNLSASSKIFIFQADKILSESEVELINNQLNKFIPQWSSHGASLKADFFVSSHLFIIIGVDENFAELGGCSKDAMNREIQTIGNDIKVDFFNRLNTAYLTPNNEIKLVNLADFKAMMKKDEINMHTKVFNNLIETKADLESNWLVEVKKSWHKNMISIV